MTLTFEDLLEENPDKEGVERAGAQRYLALHESVVPLVLSGAYQTVGRAWMGEMQRTLLRSRFELSDTMLEPAQNDASMGRHEIIDCEGGRTFYMILSGSYKGKQLFVEEGEVKSYKGGIAIDFQESAGKTLLLSELQRE